MPRLLSLLAFVLVGHHAAAAPPDFDTQVAPLLASRCLDCHGGPKPKGKLDLSRKAGAMAESLVPGKPAESELWKRVAADEMPPKKPLSEAEKKLLKEWIEAGAKWGTDPIDPFRFTTPTRAGYDWWSLQPITRPKVPEALNAQQPARTPIDRFIQSKRAEKGLTSAPEADRRTLIRRVYFDLIGLPPTPEEVDAFVADTAANAYEKVVDRLLASPHYGERWARHWLDVVRYGETDGFERNTPRPNSWHYRDWVIRALNADVPYTEFARLQLAGDVLNTGDPDAVRATGFLVAGVHNTVLGNDQMRAVARQDELEDIVGSVAQTFLGLTANCARCHDHKFDPISQTDFYRLASALGGVGFGERTLPDAKATVEFTRTAKQLAETTKELAAIEEPARKAILAERGAGRFDKLAPTPVAAWDFRKGGDDLVGKLHAKPIGGAKFTPDGATCDGTTGLFRTPALPFDLKAKTIEAWVKLDSLTQRGGGVISVQTPDGNEFDAIVFGENEPARWMAGSNGFVRYRSFDAAEERDAAKEHVHFAIAYSEDGTVTGYRNGRPYGKGYASKGAVAFKARNAVVVFGCRHEPAGGNKMLAGSVSAARVYATALSPEQIEASFMAGGGIVTSAEIDAKLAPGQRATRNALRVQRDQLSNELDRLRSRSANTRAYANVPQPPSVTRFLVRGDLATPGAVVAPAGISAVSGPKADFGLAPDAPDAERRKKLTEWITSPKNPLFARVIVNRVWHYHFGTGIVETPNDLGFNGGRPSHPELLDWLASELAEPTPEEPTPNPSLKGGEQDLRNSNASRVSEAASRAFPPLPEGRGAGSWSLKSLHQLIVTSATYRQSSSMRKDAHAKDADNRLLWRYKPHRLEGEAIRDAMLSVSGLLNPEVGGKGFSDYKIRDFNGTAYFDPFDPVGPEFHRRSVYRFTPRGANQGLLDVFDCPDPAAAAPRRAVTTTPLQALALWNNGFALRAADAFAARVQKEADGAENQIRRAWRLAYQRDPSAEEAKLAAQLVADHGLKALCRVLFNSNEFVTVE
ncbi:DUF1549 domain-containing protein [Frigoriglobus tundricola]|uniref:DUF1549 domain-containing protein n=1 Tax=Frigoriglobus tundricola TaxID=2774151 RepID=A0A6M5YJW4_9BACT|nr:DUF1549 domain-containing protein [Frigoriglobus tundricola]QJW94327.1 DUF1549 domain-containing protein [Frigoriglobus tundricola]